MTSPLLWYVNRGTGVGLLVVFSLSVVLGVLATGRGASPLWPRFVTQGLHRAAAALSVLLLMAHAVSAVVDEYVDISWWQALTPVGATYQPLWLGLGTLSLDLTLVVVATSLARSHLPHRVWSLVHLSTYPAWAAGAAHGLGIGTDAGRGWMTTTSVVCVAAVALAGLARAAVALRRHRSGPGARAGDTTPGAGTDGLDSLFPATNGGTR